MGPPRSRFKHVRVRLGVRLDIGTAQLRDHSAFAVGTRSSAEPGKPSAEVRQFFENLLPKGEALDHAAQVYGISKANLVGLMLVLGKETAGALRVVMDVGDADTQPGAAPTSDASRNEKAAV